MGLNRKELCDRLEQFDEAHKIKVIQVNDGLDDSIPMTIDDIGEDPEDKDVVILWVVDELVELQMDPYSVCMTRISQLIDQTLEHAGHMTEAEYHTILKVAKLMIVEDPAMKSNFDDDTVSKLKELE